MGQNPLTTAIRKFIRGIKTSTQLKRSESSNPFHIEVFGKCTRAIVMQFRYPDLSIILFLSRPPSKSVKVQLAFEMRMSEVLEKLPRFLETCEPLTFKAVFNGQISLRDLLERETRSLLQTAVAKTVFNRTGFEIFPPENVAIYRYPGLAASMNVEEVIKRESGLAAATRSRPSPPKNFFSRTNRKRAIFAARFREIGKPKEQKSFKESLAEVLEPEDNPWHIHIPLWKCLYRKVEITIFSSGIAAADTPHQQLALESLNSFFAAADFQSIRCIPAASHFDLGTINIDEHGSVTSYGGPISFTRNLDVSLPVTQDALTDCIAYFTKALEDPETLAQLRLRHWAGIHLMAGEFLQSFMLAWAVTEREIRRLWNKILEDRQLDKKRKDKLLTGDDFTTNQLIEIAELLAALDTKLYATVQRLRKKRNDVIHRGAIPTLEHCGECIRVANTFINRKCPRIERSSMRTDRGKGSNE